MTTEGLPLPEPAIKAWGERVGPYLESDHYTADQIRDYAAQAVKAARAAERERCAKFAYDFAAHAGVTPYAHGMAGAGEAIHHLIVTGEALAGLVDDIDGLMSESEGVYGLHLNGDQAPWSELDAGGQYERLTHLPAARELLAAAPAIAAQQAGQPTGSIMTREAAIEHCKRRRPGIEPTEQHIAATIDAYSALFGDLLPVQAEAPQASSMDDALAAGDGTLHGAVSYWQERALRAEASLHKCSFNPGCTQRCDLCPEGSDPFPAQQAGQSEDAKDAARYRWLRDRIDPREVREFFSLRGHNVDPAVSLATGAAIDRAMSSPTAKKGEA